ncbi:MAG: hypothetical protein KA175_10380 [Flavobacteriales bacterium]|nr:hypothetical protein [Flavobacteriales bacterium]MBP6698016.1 hypothetical protein [Flavobacteriales bacterium]
MKHIASFFLSCLALTSAAQNCTVTDCGFIPNINAGWKSMAVRPDGGMVGALEQGVDVGDVLAIRLDPQGQVLWTKRLATTNPLIHLHAHKVASTTDGGMLVFGYTRIYADATMTTYYPNYFAVKIDDVGTVEWARYYMKINTPLSDRREHSTIAAVDAGGYIMLLSRHDGLSAVRLDDNGLPVWHKRYSGALGIYNYSSRQGGGAIVVESDGSFCFAGRCAYQPFVVRTDANGDVLWAYNYSTAASAPMHMVKKSNGGYLVGGFLGFEDTGTAFGMSLLSDGTKEWYKYYDMYPLGGSSALELANGELLIATGYAGPIVWADANGTPLLEWTSTVPVTGENVMALNNDTLLIAVTEGSGISMQPKLVIAPEPSDLDCQYTSATSAVWNQNGTVNDSIAVAIDSLKTWTMSLGEAVELAQLDLDVMMASGRARPGFDFSYDAFIGNEGGLASGDLDITMTFDPALTFVNATPAPTSVGGNTLTWSAQPSLPGFNAFGIHVRLNVPVGLALGTPISATITVAQDSTEVSLANNAATVDQEITGSYDPNDKIVSPADFYHIENDSVLFYTIRFQNTGTDTAFTVVVHDTLPLDLSASTFEAGPSSHAYTYSLTGNGILTFTFANILLPDSNTNEPASHGMVSFRIRPHAPLTIGQVISNAADIYFDFNTPIHTADATVVVTDDTGMRPVVRREHLKVFPVPVKNILNAVPPAGFKATSAWATGVDGRRFGMALPPVREGQLQFSTQHLGAGSFVLTLQGQDGRLVSARFTKE